MKLRKFTLSSILTAFTIIIEMVVATTGESLVILTVMSALPIYLISRMDRTYGVISYLCVSTILLIVNMHQMLFFALTNGLLGLSLGICSKLELVYCLKHLICGILLFIGTCFALFIVGMASSLLYKWYWVVLILIFCLGYTCFLSWVLAKVYTIVEKFLSN